MVRQVAEWHCKAYKKHIGKNCAYTFKHGVAFKLTNYFSYKTYLVVIGHMVLHCCHKDKLEVSKIRDCLFKTLLTGRNQHISFMRYRSHSAEPNPYNIFESISRE